MMKTRILSIVALLLMAVTGAWAQGSGGDNWGPVQTSSAAWTALTEGSTTGMTLGAADATTYYYMTENLTFSNNTAGGSGLTIQGTVYIYIPSGVTLTATGADGEGTTGGGAGILVPSGTTLNIFGEGSMKMDLKSTAVLTVTYYFDALTSAPIAAHYDDGVTIDSKMNLFIDDATGEITNVSTGSIAVKMATKMDSYYFFDDYFKS